MTCEAVENRAGPLRFPGRFRPAIIQGDWLWRCGSYGRCRLAVAMKRLPIDNAILCLRGACDVLVKGPLASRYGKKPETIGLETGANNNDAG